MLQVSPGKRYQTAAEMQEDVTRIVTDPDGKATPPAAPARKKVPRVKKKEPAAVGGTAAKGDVAGHAITAVGDALTAAGDVIAKTLRKVVDSEGDRPVWPKGVGLIGVLAVLVGLILYLVALGDSYYGHLSRDVGTAAGVLGLASVPFLLIFLFIGRSQDGRFHHGCAWALVVGASTGLVALLGADSGPKTAETFEAIVWPVLGLLVLVPPFWLATVREDYFVSREPLSAPVIAVFALKNLAGVSLILASIILMELQRNSLWFVMLPVGLLATSLPGKRAALAAVLGTGLIVPLNRLREKLGKEPLVLPGSAGAPAQG